MNLIKHKNHCFAVLFLFLCSTGYLFDVLFLDKHLSAFDFLLEKPSWAVEFGESKSKNRMLSDSPTAHYPYKKEFWDAAKQGYNPQYLPHIFSGKPTSGQGVGIFSTSLFQFFMDVPNAVDFSTWFRLLLAGLFMYVFILRLGLGSAAATLGAVAWTYNMHQVAWLMFPQHLATQIWLPLLLCVNLAVLRNPLRLAPVLALILCLVIFFTSGYTQIVLYSFVFLGVFNTLYVIFVSKDQIKAKVKNWTLIHLAYLSAGLILLPDALWQAQEIADGLRGTQDFRYNRFSIEFSFSALVQLANDLLPRSIDVIRFLTPNYKSELGQIPPIRGILNSNVVEFQVYFGLLCLFLTIYGVIKSLTERNRLLCVFVVMMFLCIALFNGNATIISLLNLIPFAGSGTYSRIITLILLMAITIASFGARFFIEDLVQKRYGWLIFSLLLIIFWLGSARYIHSDTVSFREFIPWLIYLGLVIVSALLLIRKSLSLFVLPMMIGLTFMELLLTSYNFNTRIDAKDHFPENAIIKRLVSEPGDFRTALLMNNTSYHHNILSYYDLSTLGGYETTAPTDYLYFMREAYKRIHVTLNGILFLFDGNLDVLRLLNTHFIVSNLNLNSDLIKPIYSNQTESLYEMINPLDRVYCASDQIANPNVFEIPHQLGELARTNDRPVVLSEKVMKSEVLTENCKVSELNVYSSKLEFNVQADQDTLVFIATNYHPYWSAIINGENAQIIKANYSFMALKVNSGQSKIVLEFINSKLTLAAVLLLLLGIATIAISILRITPKWQKIIFIACGMMLISKSMLSIPGVMNTNVFERPINQAQK